MHPKSRGVPWAIAVAGVAAYIYGINKYGGITAYFVAYVMLVALTAASLFAGIALIKKARKTESKDLVRIGPYTGGCILLVLGVALVGILVFQPEVLNVFWLGSENGAPVVVIAAVAYVFYLLQRRTAKDRRSKKTGGKQDSTTVNNMTNGGNTA